jgi:hypothetical protein
MQLPLGKALLWATIYLPHRSRSGMILPEVPLAGALFLALPASVPPERRQILILAGYFDESGTHDAAAAISVAGYLSTPERWEVFEQEWKKALDDFVIPFFHMADFANNAPPYYNTWTPEQKLERFDRLAKIINDHILISVGYSFSVPRYRAIFSAGAKRAGGGAYGVAANCCFMEAAKFIKESLNPEAWVRYFFESGAQGAGEILKNFQLNVRTPQQKEHYRTLALSFEDKREFCPLQAADILAYELYRYYPRRVGIDMRSGARRELLALVTEQKKWCCLDDEALGNWSMVVEAYGKIQKLSKKERMELLKRYPPWGEE